MAKKKQVEIIDLAPAKPQAARWRAILGASFLFVAVFVVYIPALRSGFIWDDPQHITDNLTLRTLDGLRLMWFVPLSLPQWYPLVHTTFWIEYHLVGADPTLYHFDNVLLHAISCVLLWRLLAKLEIPGAFLAACIFAVHPVMVESVAWVTERKNCLSLVFYLLAMRMYLFRFAPTNEPNAEPNWRAYGAAMALFLAALFSKTVTASFPAAILLILWWKSGRLRLRDLAPLLPFFIVGAIMGYITGHIEATHVNGAGQLEIEMHYSIASRCLIAGRAICFYFSKLVWPHPLMFMYPRWDEVAKPTAGQWAFPAIVVLVSVALFGMRKRIGRGPIVAWLLFCGTLVPALGFVNVYPMRYSFVADHFQYHASIAIIVLIACAFMKLVQRVKVPAQIAVACALLAGLGFLTWRQASIYKDAWTLWSDTARKDPGSWMVWANLGNLLLKQERYEDAAPYYQKAFELAPNIDENLCNIGSVYLRQGKIDEAEGAYNRALQINPSYAVAFGDLGFLYLNKKSDATTALDYYRKELSAEPEPGTPEAHFHIGSAMERLAADAKKRATETKRPEDAQQWLSLLTGAIQEYETAASMNPDFREAHYNAANCLMQIQRFDAAIAHLGEALRIDPNYAEGWTNLGNAYFQTGQFREAAGAFDRALRINPNLEPAKKGLMAARVRG